jgi:small-conductance mechanosensitive channel
MPPSASASQVLVDFWLSLVKLLGRPVVQMQLLAALGAVVLAWLLARWIVGTMQRLRDQIMAEEQTPQARDSRGTTDEAITGSAPWIDEDALEKAVEKRLGVKHRIYLLVQQLVFPGLAILLLYGVYVVFVVQGWYSGLLADLIFLFAIYLLYRLALGLAYALASPQRVRYYHQRLFAPLFGVLVALLFVNAIIDINTVAAATLVPVEDGWLTLGAVFVATFGFYLWIMVLSLVKDSITALVRRRGRTQTGSLDAALTLAQYGLIALGLFAVFRALQFNTATIAAITGGLSIGLGFALQDVIKNFLGGIIVLFEGSVRPGDWVQIAGTEGEVDKLSIRSTVVRSFDDVEYIVPNQDWLSSTVTTFTRTRRRVRMRVPIRVSSEADPHFVQQLLIETARSQPDIMDEPSPLAPIMGFSAASIDLVVLAWVEDARDKEQLAAELRLRTWDVLKANGVEVR